MVQRGDYAPLMARVLSQIRQAEAHVANDSQLQMLQRYGASFELGSIEEHKDASRHWIQDKSPIIESYIGFIESYRGMPRRPQLLSALIDWVGQIPQVFAGSGKGLLPV